MTYTLILMHILVLHPEIGEELESSVKDAEATEDISEIESKATELRKSIDSAYISASLKTNLRDRIEALQKKVTQAKKAALAARVDIVLNDVKEKALEAVEAKKDSLVMNVDIGAESKASQTVMNTIKSIAPDLAFMGISEEEMGSGGKVLCFAVVPPSLNEQGLNANEWVKETLATVGGRGGGKPVNAQGQAPSCDDVDALIASGAEFAEKSVGTKV